MKVLYLVSRDSDALDETLQQMIVEQKKDHQVRIANINLEKNYNQLVDMIIEADRVISW